jgi:hypothetical protein
MKPHSLFAALVTTAALVAPVAAQNDTGASPGVPICMPPPRVAVGENAPIVSALSEQFRDQIAAYLAGPLVEPRGIEARLPVQARAEAVAQKCHYILNITFTHKPKSRIGRRTAESALVVGSAAQSLGSMSQGASGALSAASTLGGLFGRRDSGSGAGAGSGFYPVGKNDQVEIQYSLELVDAAAVKKAAKLGGKAAKDNEPLVDTLVEKMAGEIVTAVGE